MHAAVPLMAAPQTGAFKVDAGLGLYFGARNPLFNAGLGRRRERGGRSGIFAVDRGHALPQEIELGAGGTQIRLLFAAIVAKPGGS
jgi:hypothetical protein